MAGDRSVELVVMCKNKPTLPLLTKMGEALKEQVKVRHLNSKIIFLVAKLLYNSPCLSVRIAIFGANL